MRDHYLRPEKHHAPTGRTPVVPRDPRTRIGFTETVQYVDTTTAEEQAFAEAALAGKPAGTKLYCYDREPIEYKDPTDPTKTIYLNNDFRTCEKRFSTGETRKIIYAISLDKLRPPIEKDSDEGRSIPQIHWDIAERALAGQVGGRLQAYRKVYKDDLMRHCFMVFMLERGAIILAMAGSGWKFENGSMSTVMPASQQYAVKLPRPLMLAGHILRLIESETTLSLMTGLFHANAHKPSGRPVFLMRLYEMDFFTWFTRESLPVIATKKAQYLTILIKTVFQLRKLHQKNIVHRDVKPVNILVSFSDGVIAVALSDLGIALQTTDGTVARQGWAGTPGYSAPEILPESCVQGNRVYSFASDTFAMGRTIARSNMHAFKDRDLMMLTTRMMDSLAGQRPHLAYVELSLIVLLSKTNGIDLGTLLSEHHFPLEKSLAALLNHFFINASSKLSASIFSDSKYLDRFIWLQQEASSLGLTQEWLQGRLEEYKDITFDDKDNPTLIQHKLNNLVWLYNENGLATLAPSDCRRQAPIDLWENNEAFWQSLDQLIQNHTAHKSSGDCAAKDAADKAIQDLIDKAIHDHHLREDVTAEPAACAPACR